MSDRTMRNDLANAETMGTILLVGVIAAAVSVAATTTLGSDAEPTSPPELGVVAQTRAGSDVLFLTRTAGENVDLGDLRVLVARNGAPWLDAPAGPAGTPWPLGATIRVDLPEPLERETGSDVTLVWAANPHSAAVAQEIRPEIVVPTQAPARGGLTISPTLDPATPLVVRPTQNFLAQALVDHEAGRKLVLSVTGTLPGLSAATALHDDGTAGDAVAGDGIYSGYFTVPVEALPGMYPFVITATDIEGSEATSVVWIQVPEPQGRSGSLEAPPEAAPPETESPSAQAAPPQTNFSILPGGGITPLCRGPAEALVVGTQITYGAGGPTIPVRTWATQNDGSSFISFAGGSPVQAGDTVVFADVPAGAVLGVRGAADYATFHALYTSFQGDPHVVVLRDGSSPPNVPAFDGQKAVKEYLDPYVTDGLIDLAVNEAIILFEFNGSLTSTAADFQDLVVIFTIGCT